MREHRPQPGAAARAPKKQGERVDRNTEPESFVGVRSKQIVHPQSRIGKPQS